MATLILRDTYLALEEKIKSIDRLRTETSLKIKEAASHGDLKENYEYKAAKEEMSLVIYKKPNSKIRSKIKAFFCWNFCFFFGYNYE